MSLLVLLSPTDEGHVTISTDEVHVTISITIIHR